MPTFEERYRPMEKELFLVAVGYLKNTEDAQDVVQDAAIAGYLSYHTLKDEALFKPWLTRIVINQCLDHLRRKKIRQKYTEKIADSMGAFARIPEEEIALMDLICQLPLKLRPYIILRFYHALTYKEVAQLLRVPEATARSRTKSALSALAQLMER